MRNTDNAQDILDVRDIIARYEELEEKHDAIKAEFDSDPDNAGVDFLNRLRNHPDFSTEETDEFLTLKALLDDMKGGGGDEQWRGDWYPVTMIRDAYFETAMDELLEDCGDLEAYDKRPSYIKISIDYDALQMDYTSVDYDGEIYWYR